MSYARFSSESDVYVYLSVGGWLECCACRLNDVTGENDPFPDSERVFSTADMPQHLTGHRLASHDVPQRCIDGLVADAAEIDAWMSSKGAAR